MPFWRSEPTDPPAISPELKRTTNHLRALMALERSSSPGPAVAEHDAAMRAAEESIKAMENENEIERRQSRLDAAVSEQIARRVAMKAATENADEMIRDISMKYNRARQTQITSELSEIIGGAAALE